MTEENRVDAGSETTSVESVNKIVWRGPERKVYVAERALRPSASRRNPLTVILQHASLYVARRPRLKKKILSLLGRFPGLKLRLAMAARTAAAVDSLHALQMPSNLENLNPRARKIYLDLKKFSNIEHGVD